MLRLINDQAKSDRERETSDVNLSSKKKEKFWKKEGEERREKKKRRRRQHQSNPSCACLQWLTVKRKYDNLLGLNEDVEWLFFSWRTTALSLSLYLCLIAIIFLGEGLFSLDISSVVEVRVFHALSLINILLWLILDRSLIDRSIKQTSDVFFGLSISNQMMRENRLWTI